MAYGILITVTYLKQPSSNPKPKAKSYPSDSHLNVWDPAVGPCIVSHTPSMSLFLRPHRHRDHRHSYALAVSNWAPGSVMEDRHGREFTRPLFFLFPDLRFCPHVFVPAFCLASGTSFTLPALVGCDNTS